MIPEISLGGTQAYLGQSVEEQNSLKKINDQNYRCQNNLNLSHDQSKIFFLEEAEYSRNNSKGETYQFND